MADEAVNRIGAILEELGARFDLVVEAVWDSADASTRCATRLRAVCGSRRPDSLPVRADRRERRGIAATMTISAPRWRGWAKRSARRASNSARS